MKLIDGEKDGLRETEGEEEGDADGDNVIKIGTPTPDVVDELTVITITAIRATTTRSIKPTASSFRCK